MKKSNFTIEFLGHAGMAFKIDGQIFLMDPWISKNGAFASSWFQLPKNHYYNEIIFKNIKGIFLSHDHLDHYDPDYLSTLNADIPIYIPSFPSENFYVKIKNDLKRRPKFLNGKKIHSINGMKIKILFEESPMNQDSVWVIKVGSTSIVNTIDSRLNEQQVYEILEFIGGKPDALTMQFSGASWYPVCYMDAKEEESKIKLENKIKYGLRMADLFDPEFLIVNAGPPVFLDTDIFHVNDDVSFINPGEVKSKLKALGYKNKVIDPLPSDILDLKSKTFIRSKRFKNKFEWSNHSSYLINYKNEMEASINNTKLSFQKDNKTKLFLRFQEHFNKLFKLNSYFNRKIDSNILFSINGDEGGEWLVVIKNDIQLVKIHGNEKIDIKYEMDSYWLNSILKGKLGWEEFFLGCRFSVKRFNNTYNDHFLGLLKFANRGALKAVEKYEKNISSEVIIVDSDGELFEIDKYCPHAGATMENAPIKDGKITCLLHNYIFDLESGKCLNGNCTLRSKKLKKESV